MLVTGNTGEQVKKSGTYINGFGKKVELNEGDDFPACPKEGKPISWKRID